MADNLQGFNDELANNAVNAAQRIGEIQDAVRSLRRVLQGETVSTTKEFTDLTASANKFRTLQEKAAKSGKEINKLYQEQSKIHDTITRLSAKLQIANEKAFVASGKQRKNLEKQAEALMHMRDEAKQISNYYEQLVQSTAKLDKSSAYFTQLSKVVDKIPILNKFQKPFEKAAEAARKTAIEAKRAQQISATVEKRVDKNGKEYYVDLVKGGRTSKTNFLQDKAKVDEAAVASKKSPFTAGMKAIGSEMGEGMSGLMKGGGWIALLVEAIKFIVELFVAAQKNTVNIARDLGITRDSAEAIRKSYVDIAGQSSMILINSEELVKAQTALVDYSGTAGRIQKDTLENQVYLTKHLGLSEQAAADLNYTMEATGQNAKSITDSVGITLDNFKKIHGFGVPYNRLMQAVAKTSKEIQGYFGFSVDKIAKGVLQISKFGLELDKALSLSKSLLDFESSIGNELELELLTGKEFNLEKARALAVTGKIADATEEVMSQMQDLTEEQRKSPLVMESMSKATGLSADELNRAFVINKKLNKEAKEYADYLIAHGKQKELNNAIDLLGETASRAEIERTVTVQEAFQAAMAKAKDQLSKFANSGALDKLVDVVMALVNTVSKHGVGGLFSLTGKSEFVKEIEKNQTERYSNAAKGYQERIKNKETLSDYEKQDYQRAQSHLILQNPDKEWKNISSMLGKSSTDAQKNTLEKLRLQAGGSRGFFKTAISREIEEETWARAEKMGIDDKDARDIIEAEAAKKLQEIQSGTRTINAKTGKTETKLKDFIIKPLNEDTITMAGGTKLGGNVENLLMELIKEVKAGRNIYLGTQKVNEALGLSLNALG